MGQPAGPGRCCGDKATIKSTETGPDWSALLAAAQQGDGDAYRAFLKAILPFARAIARRRLRSEEQVEDAVQDALLTLQDSPHLSAGTAGRAVARRDRDPPRHRRRAARRPHRRARGLRRSGA